MAETTQKIRIFWVAVPAAKAGGGANKIRNKGTVQHFSKVATNTAISEDATIQAPLRALIIYNHLVSLGCGSRI